MDHCPHCDFLIRDDDGRCGVCGKAVRGPEAHQTSNPFGSDEVVSSRIGTGEAGYPAAVLVMCVMGLAMAIAVWFVSAQVA